MSGRTLHRILLAEDEPDIQAVTRMALEMIGGFTVELCEGGGEVRSKALEFRPDVILMDIMMPGMDGPAAFRSLQEDPRTSTIPVIFMTARVQPQEVAGYREMGAMGVIPKPFNPLTLTDKVTRLWEESHEHEKAELH
jgi:CheY-like chemotaxis protein